MYNIVLVNAQTNFDNLEGKQTKLDAELPASVLFHLINGLILNHNGTMKDCCATLWKQNQMIENPKIELTRRIRQQLTRQIFNVLNRNNVIFPCEMNPRIRLYLQTI